MKSSIREWDNRKKFVAVAAVAALLLLGLCVSTSANAELSCDSLASDVIAMSEERDVKILEISSAEALWGGDGELTCKGHAIWSDGDEGPIHYEVSISPGGQSMLSYREG